MSDFSAGRVILGIGGGVEAPSSVWMEPWGQSRPRPVRAVRELVHLCRVMWSGERTPTTGEVLRGSGLQLNFPVRDPIPILIAARGEQMLRLGGEIADIVHIAAPFLGGAYIATTLDRIAEGAARAGRTPDSFEVDLTVSACVMADGDLARSLSKTTTGAGILWVSGAEQYAQRRPRWTVPAELDVSAELIQELADGWDMWSGEKLPDRCADLIDEHVLRQFSVAGTPEDCAGQLFDLTSRFPQITGLRLKLPPVSGPESFDHYVEMMKGFRAVVEMWPQGASR